MAQLKESFDMKSAAENRGHPRMDVLEIQADISDGNEFFSGTVKNISRFGLAISDIPDTLDRDSDMYSIILDGPGIHFKLLVRPVWEQHDDGHRTIGAVIENSPWTWTDYVMGKEPLDSLSPDPLDKRHLTGSVGTRGAVRR